MAKANEKTVFLNEMKFITKRMMENQLGEPKRRGKRLELDPPILVRTYHQMAKVQINKRLESISNEGLAQIRNSASPKINASKTAFSKLKPMTIPELTYEESATGKYVLARVIEDWHSLVAWNNVIEDHRGHVIALALYNYPVEEMFSLGDVIIIKEPYLRLSTDNFSRIRCDCPTDIIVLRPAHHLFPLAKSVQWKNNAKVNDPLMTSPIPTNATQWKERGNGLFAGNQLILAREAYYLALGVCSDEDPIAKILQLNLLAVQLRLEYYEWVVENGEKFLMNFPEEKKAIFRVGKAYYGLRNYDKALQAYQNFCKKFPNEKEGVIELERAKDRVRETKGEFDFDKLLKMSIEKPLDEIDCADYCGPVEITKIPGKGRGLLLTKDVTKGTVLIVAKAIAAILDPLQTMGLQIEPDKRCDGNRDRAENVAKMSRLIMKNPNSFGPQIYNLYSGRDMSEPVQLFCDPDEKSEPISDLQLIKDISKCNSFSISGNSHSQENQKGAGLFSLPSYMNHSCTPNANAYEFYNDVMVVRALKNMKEGTEVTTSYIPLNQSFEERAKLLADRGFRCRCSRCKRRT